MFAGRGMESSFAEAQHGGESVWCGKIDDAKSS